MTEVTKDNVPARKWRLKLGVTLFVLSITLPVLGVPLAAAIGLSAATVATISGSMLVLEMVLEFVAVAVMGKSGYAYIKNRVFSFLNMRCRPPAEVSRTRYTIGLVMFTVPIVFGWLAPYAAVFSGYLGNEFTYAIAIVGDLLLLASLFVLGGDFWDKLRALFIHGAKAVFPKTNDRMRG